jgi:hypothetical protein
MCLEIYIVTRVILGTNTGALVIAVLSLAIFVVFWLLVPRLDRRR